MGCKSVRLNIKLTFKFLGLGFVLGIAVDSRSRYLDRVSRVVNKSITKLYVTSNKLYYEKEL